MAKISRKKARHKVSGQGEAPQKALARASRKPPERSRRTLARANGDLGLEAAAGWPSYAAEFLALVPGHSMALWVARYVKDEVIGVQAANTFEAKVRDLGGFVLWLSRTHGEADIGAWMARDTQRYLRLLEREGKAPATINRVFASLRRFARWAQEQPGGLLQIHGSPVRGVKELAVDEPDCKKLGPQDVHRLLRAADRLVDLNGAKERKNARPRRNRAILALLLYTGMRVSELVSLRRDQWQGKHLLNVARKGQGRTKAIYLVKDAQEALREYWRHERALDDPRGDEDFLLLGTFGGHLWRQSIGDVLRGIAQEASKSLKTPIHLHPHRLRHTFGALVRDKTGSDTETAAALGHTSLAHVKRYVRKSQKEREEAMDDLFAGI